MKASEEHTGGNGQVVVELAPHLANGGDHDLQEHKPSKDEGGKPGLAAGPSLVGRGMRVSFQDCDYVVKNEANKKEDLYLLRGVTGFMNAGEMLALMGPSGSGKTTLLDVLAERKTTGRMNGDVLFAGTKPTRAFMRRYTGYVEQHDTLLPNLTVYEMLLYTAELKRPLQESTAAKKAATEEVIAELALEQCRDTRIGNTMARGISGGQSKRVNIGIALITQPRVLFLDEPTSGLDSFTSNEVMAYVKALVAEGITICATIHSPTAYTFSLFDRVLLLLRGRVVYFGPNGDATCDYFQGPSMPKVEGVRRIDNLAEWIVDLTTKGDRLGMANEFGDAYDASPLREENDKELKNLACEGCQINQATLDVLQSTRETVTPSWWALWTLFRYRTLKDYRDPDWLGPRIGDKIIFSLVSLTLFWGVGDTTDPGKYIVVAAVLFMSITLPAFGAAAYTPALVLERPLFIRERNDGLYRVLTYLIWKVCSELMLATAVSALTTMWIWFAVDLRGLWVIFWWAYLVTLAWGIVLAYLIAALSPNMDVANAALPAYVVTLLLMATFLIPISDVPGWWIWYVYLNPLRYAWGATMKNQFGDCCTEVFLDDQSILEYYSLAGISPWVWLAIEASMAVVFFVGAWAALSFVRHQKR